jgi:hypothetical protein
MRSSKQKQDFSNAGTSTNASTTTSSVGENADVQALRDYKAPLDPGISYQFSRLRKGLEQGFNDPLGGSYAPQVQDAIIRSGESDLGQQEAEANRQGQYQSNLMDQGRLSQLAEMTAPRTATSTGTSTGTQSGTGTMTQTPSALSTASQVAGGIASGFA